MGGQWGLPRIDAAPTDRHAVLQRGAGQGGSLVWTVPAVQTLAGSAFATGTPPPQELGDQLGLSDNTTPLAAHGQPLAVPGTG